METKRNNFPKFMSPKDVAIIFQARKINLFIFIRAELLFCLPPFLIYVFSFFNFICFYNYVDLDIQVHEYKNEERPI